MFFNRFEKTIGIYNFPGFDMIRPAFYNGQQRYITIDNELVRILFDDEKYKKITNEKL